jgi:RNA polymerase sigma-70 factor (ECF subfamily)
MSADSRSDLDLLDAARSGDEGALAVLVERHRDRLERMVGLRMDRRLQGRFDPADVVQEAYLAEHLPGKLTTPGHAAIRAELKVRVQEALNSMDPNDREVLILRHFEDLSNAEAAQVLGIKPTAAVNRYVRALKRLKDVFQAMPGGLEGIWA